MPALIAGKKAPAVGLPDTHGKSFSLRDALRRGPVLLAFFKVTCPVCQYVMPLVERLHQAFKSKAQVIGISQHPKKETQQFMREYGISMPVLLDDPESYAVSNAYGLTNVPTLFLIASDGEIQISSVGWNRKDFEAINRALATAASIPPPAVFGRGEDIVDYKAG